MTYDRMDKPLEKIGYQHYDCSHLRMPCDEYLSEEGDDYESIRFHDKGFVTVEAVSHIDGVGKCRIPAPLNPQEIKAIYEEMKNRGWSE